MTSFTISLSLFIQANTMKTMSQQILVRNWQYEDAPALLSLGKDRNMKRSWNYSYPYTQHRAEDCIQYFLHANPLHFVIYAILIDNRLNGWIQAKAIGHQCAEITFWLKKYNQDTTVLQMILRQMIPLAFSHLDVLTLYMKTNMSDFALCEALRQTGFTENNETVPIYLYFLHLNHVHYQNHHSINNLHT